MFTPPPYPFQPRASKRFCKMEEDFNTLVRHGFLSKDFVIDLLDRVGGAIQEAVDMRERKKA